MEQDLLYKMFASRIPRAFTWHFGSWQFDTLSKDGTPLSLAAVAPRSSLARREKMKQFNREEKDLSNSVPSCILWWFYFLVLFSVPCTRGHAALAFTFLGVWPEVQRKTTRNPR